MSDFSRADRVIAILLGAQALSWITPWPWYQDFVSFAFTVALVLIAEKE